MNFVLRGLQSPINVINLLMNLALKGSNSSISKSVKHYLYTICISPIYVMIYSPTVALPIFDAQWSATMQLTFAKI